MKGVVTMEIAERDAVMRQLSPEQQSFLLEQLKRGKRTLFARQLAMHKGAHIPENASSEDLERLVSDWIYVEYVDAGHVSKSHLCECGRSLRYQHTVQHKTTGEIKRFGIEHLQLHTGIDAKTVELIVKGFNAIDLELTEVLWKVTKGWTLAEEIGDIPPGVELPKDIAAHLSLDLPLLQRQLVRLREAIRRHFDRTPPTRSDVGQPSIRREDEPVQPHAPHAAASTPAPDPSPHADTSKSNTSLEEDNGQLAFDLFGELTALQDAEKAPPSPPVQTTAPVMPAALGTNASAARYDWSLPYAERFPEHLQHASRQYIAQGVRSVRVLCELLIKQHGASGERFRTGKPMLYGDVCLLLDRQLAFCKLIEHDQDDRVYAFVDPANDENGDL